MAAKTKYSIGKRISQFLSKIFWHLNQQSTPTYSNINQKCLTSLSSKKSINKHGLKSSNRNSSIDRYNIRSQYPARYRTCSMRERTSTLTSIQEE
jgi:hypothetical protein